MDERTLVWGYGGSLDKPDESDSGLSRGFPHKTASSHHTITQSSHDFVREESTIELNVHKHTPRHTFANIVVLKFKDLADVEIIIVIIMAAAAPFRRGRRFSIMFLYATNAS